MPRLLVVRTNSRTDISSTKRLRRRVGLRDNNLKGLIVISLDKHFEKKEKGKKRSKKKRKERKRSARQQDQQDHIVLDVRPSIQPFPLNLPHNKSNFVKY